MRARRVRSRAARPFVCVVVVLALFTMTSAARAQPIVVGDARFADQAKPDAVTGQLLLNELACARCHDGLPVSAPGIKPAPDLRGITQRVRIDWLRAFIANPHHVKPGTTMPDVVGDSEQAVAADGVDAIVHYLATHKPAKSIVPLPRRSKAARGNLLYHRYGCAACHRQNAGELERGRPILSSGNSSLDASVPLPDLGAKYSHRSLTDFLLDPLRYRPAGRMPNLNLNVQDASDIAAYLVRKSGNLDNTASSDIKPIKPDPGKATRGRAFFVSVGCANCHTLDGASPNSRGSKFSAVTIRTHGGCGGPIDYKLTKRQARSIAAAIDQHTSAAKLKPGEQLDLSLRTFNCYVCHARGERGGIPDTLRHLFTGDPDLADEGRFPPALTGVGRKLTPTWIAKVLNGQGHLRPYLHTRMPTFGPKNTQHLPDLFVQVDEGMRHKPDEFFAEGDVEAGRKLMGTQGGLSCIQCHGWNDRKSLGIPAINLGSTAQRMQPAWFKDNLLHPARLRPRTLMPAYWPNGKGVNKNFFNGDPHRQIASLWQYLAKGKTPPPGYPDFEKGEFELTPTGRPIVMRTFAKQVGTHAILVGFPQGVHLAFDGLNCRPTLVWRGRFIDAYSTWFDRFVAPVEPLEEQRVTLPSSMPLARGDVKRDWPTKDGKSLGYRFRGYRLDKNGVPTFLYDYDGVRIEDRFEPVEQADDTPPTLRRTLTLTGRLRGLGFQPGKAKDVTMSILKPRTPSNDLPITFDADAERAVVELEYRW